MTRTPTRFELAIVALGFTAGVIGGCVTSAPDDAVYACDHGTCPDGLACVSGFCVKQSASCSPKTCADVGANCGRVADGCGQVLDCGTCTAPDACGGGGVSNVCGAPSCTPETGPAMCARFNRGCGTLTETDNCGAQRTIECGDCPPGQACTDTFQCDLCSPKTPEQLCAAAGVICVNDFVVKNCATTEHVSCGCPGGFCLDAGACCLPASDATLCLGRCGPLTATDNCGLPRELDCGGCAGGESCTAQGTCGACVPESDDGLCQRLGKNCGQLTAEDNCGVTRTVSCGGCDPSGPACGVSSPNVCGCNPNLSTCSSNADCCSGTCGPASLCCVAPNQPCNDDSECCNGECALGRCRAFVDAGP